MNNEKHRLSIQMTKEMHEAVLAVRAEPEHRSESIGAVIRMLIEKGLEEVEKDK